MHILDFHTHNPAEPDAIVSGSPMQVVRWLDQYPSAIFSVGIHPWDTLSQTMQSLSPMLRQLDEIALHPRIVAIGETGLDSLRGAPLELQRALLLHHITCLLYTSDAADEL